MERPYSDSHPIPLPVAPRIIPRAEHCISRAHIDERALKVLYRLKNAGFGAYLVGGCVRDLLLGREPKDFDVATDALPEQVRELFRNCRLIGRRFRLAHVHFGRDVIEVATFRAQARPGESDDMVMEDGRIIRDNVYGTIEEDVWRRDFTVNALYYNIEDFSVVDYVGGMEDVRAGQLRLIGPAGERYQEDPVRMLRAVRFAAKLGFRIHPDSEAPLFELGALLEDIAPARLFEEVLKLLGGGAAVQTFELLRHYGLFARLFPEEEKRLAEEEGGFPHMLLVRALENTDARLAEGKPINPGFLCAALLWDAVRRASVEFQAEGVPELEAQGLAADAVISRQVARVAFPRRFTQVTREIWALQHRFERRGGRRPLRLLEHPRFRAAYDFLLLRAQAGEVSRELANWWTEFQDADEDGRRLLIASSGEAPGRRRGGGRRRRRH